MPARFTTAVLLATLSSTTALSVDWRFTEDFDALTTGNLVSLDGEFNPAKANILHTTASPPTTYEAQFGGGAANASTVINNGALELTTTSNGGSEAFSVLSTGQEANAPRGIMAATSVKFRLDGSTDPLGNLEDFHISWYRNLVHNGTQNDGPWVNNLASIGFRDIGGGQYDLWGNGYLSPFANTEDSLPYQENIVTLNTDTWYTAEIYLPAFNADNSLEHVDAQYRILDETGTQLLAYNGVLSHHQTRELLFTSFSTENTPEVVGIQTISTRPINATWSVDDLKIGVGTGADIDAVYANQTTTAGNYYDYDFDGDVDADDASFYVVNYLQSQVGDVDLDRDVDNDDLAIAQGNLNNPGGWDDGDVTGDAQVTQADIDLIQSVIGGGEILGDYNDNGLVEQGDLNQVLNNWGTDFASVAATWILQRPTEGIVDQAELNVVLNRWGSDATPDFSGSAVPEPGALLAIAGFSALATRRRR